MLSQLLLIFLVLLFICVHAADLTCVCMWFLFCACRCVSAIDNSANVNVHLFLPPSRELT